MESRNVVAELEGEGDGVVVVGAHYDVVPQTETGANDNTSGTAVVLSLAACPRNNFCVRYRQIKPAGLLLSPLFELISASQM